MGVAQHCGPKVPIPPYCLSGLNPIFGGIYDRLPYETMFETTIPCGKLMEIEVPSLGVPQIPWTFWISDCTSQVQSRLFSQIHSKSGHFHISIRWTPPFRPENAHHLRFSKHLLQLQSLPERSLLGVFLQAVAPVNRVQLAQLCWQQ